MVLIPRKSRNLSGSNVARTLSLEGVRQPERVALSRGVSPGGHCLRVVPPPFKTPGNDVPPPRLCTFSGLDRSRRPLTLPLAAPVAGHALARKSRSARNAV